MRSLSTHFQSALTSLCGVQPGESLVVAVSGGPDSMALLHLLSGIQHRLGLTLSVVWVDHGLRPDETRTEAMVVEAATKKLNLPCFVRQVDVSAFALQSHLSIEHAARELRYQVLREIMGQQQADYIAVGHTADDQAEEVLLRLLRGSGRKGISGMTPRSADIVRPLLNIEKKELLNWLVRQEISFCLDSSNEDDSFLRNRVRHQLLPFLEEKFDPGIRKSLRKTADSLARDETLLEELTDNAAADVLCEVGSAADSDPVLQLIRQPFCELHPALQRRVVEKLLWGLGAKASYDHILAVCQAAESGRNRSELHLSRGLRVGVHCAHLEFSYPAGQLPWRGKLFG